MPTSAEDQIVNELEALGGRPLWKRNLTGTVEATLYMWAVKHTTVLIEILAGGVEVYVPVSDSIQIDETIKALRERIGETLASEVEVKR